MHAHTQMHTLRRACTDTHRRAHTRTHARTHARTQTHAPVQVDLGGLPFDLKVVRELALAPCKQAAHALTLSPAASPRKPRALQHIVSTRRLAQTAPTPPACPTGSREGRAADRRCRRVRDAPRRMGAEGQSMHGCQTAGRAAIGTRDSAAVAVLYCPACRAVPFVHELVSRAGCSRRSRHVGGSR